MPRSVRYALAFLFVAIWLVSWRPISDLATRVLSSLEQYMLQYPPEKVYILTDKPHYAAGENLWFKGWLVNGADHFPNSPSKLVYVELVAPDSTVVLQQTLRVVDGTLNGDFYLPHELMAGSYDLRAYTKWMRNFNQNYFFHREVTIGNLSAESSLRSFSDNRISMRFFPEGGEWIEGLPAVLGVEALNSYGEPSSGVVVAIQDKSGNEITRFNTGGMGLSHVELTPQKGVDHIAVIMDAFDSRLIGQSFELPKPLANGFQMKIDATRDREIGIRILNNIDAARLNSQEIVIIGHVRGIVYYAAVGRADRNEFIAQVDRSRFPPGIIQFTLFTEAGLPVAERLVYNPDPAPLTVFVESNEEAYTVRDMAEVTISVKDVDGEPVDGNIAISVTDVSQVTWPDNGLDVRNYLHLVSDLDGPVLQPGLYDQLSDSALVMADKLMLTRGWRRFDWQKVMSSDGPHLQHALEQGLAIRGTVVNKQNKRAVTGQNVILALLGGVKEFYDTETDEQGQFKFENLIYPDSTEVLLQTLDTRKRRHYDIILETIINYDPRIRKQPATYQQNVNSLYLSYLNQSRMREQIDRSFGLSNDVRMLGEVTVTAAREALQPPERRSLIVDADRVIKAEDVRGYASNPLDMLRGRTAAFRVTGVGRDMTVTFNRGIAWGGDPVPLFILDGMEVDLMTLVSIPASNVESIELLTDVGSLAVYGSRGSNGVIAVNTKPGGAVFAARKGIINRAFAGYYIPREFYAPDYSEHLDIHEKPDSRTTIYWEPNLILNSNGIGYVRFWTSDDTGPRFQNTETKYRVHVEGITSTGRPIVGRSYLVVK